MTRNAGLAIALIIMAVMFAVVSARDTHRTKTQAADAIKLAEDWKQVAERWQKIAHEFEIEAQKCR